MDWRAEEKGKSKCLVVMARIKAEKRQIKKKFGNTKNILPLTERNS
jgi:hypothetical protein